MINTKTLFPEPLRKIGNGKTETRFLTILWQSNKLLDPINDHEEMTK